jgi:beta-lactamase superfamily II metal-dependent hydrolase
MKRLIVAVLLVVGWAPLGSAQTLRIYHIDVEQADAALIIMPNGKTLLVDSGKNRQGSRIKAVMDLAGVTRIDAFVNSHYHEDHFGGIDDLVKMGVSVLETYDRGKKEFVDEEEKQKPTFEGYMAAVGEDAHALRPGDTIDLDPLVTVRCIAASGFVIGEADGPPPTHEENDLSVSILVTFAGFKAFFGGDTHLPTEVKIAALDLVTDVDLYKSDHHGSDTSSSQALMDDLQPSLIVISNGSNGTYRHPRLSTLQRYTTLLSAPVILQTNKCKKSAPCGNMPDAFIADPQSSDKDGTILITVDAVTSSYTARYGNTVRPFSIKNPTGPQPTATSTVVIESLLPNPVGADEQREEVTLRNQGTSAISLAGWRLRDRSGLHWDLSGTIAAGQSTTFRRNGQAMTLNNQGDEIVLLDQSSTERDRFSYTSSTEGTLNRTLH